MKMTPFAIRYGLALLAILFLNGCAVNLAAQSAAPGKGESLYKRAGGDAGPV